MGVRCWLDEKQMLPGDDIYEQVDRVFAGNEREESKKGLLALASERRAA
jgi:hypothetical protein